VTRNRNQTGGPRRGDRSITQTDDEELRAAFLSMSKATLFDLALDLVRRVEGNEHLDGAPLYRALVEAYEPIRCVRGERLLPSYRRERYTREQAQARILAIVRDSPSGTAPPDWLAAQMRADGGWSSNDVGYADVRRLVDEGVLERVLIGGLACVRVVSP